MSQTFTFVLIFVVLFVGCESLRCYSYVGDGTRTEKSCVSGTRYCLKGVLGGSQVGGACEETGKICTGNGCGTGDTKTCCCDTDLCNSGTFVQSTMSAIAFSLFAFIVTRFIFAK